MRIPHAAIAVALVVSPNDAFVLPPRQRNVRSQCLAMVVETPPELAEYMKTKLGTASAINVDDALDEARKERQRDATEAAAKREETIQNETQATMSPEVAEYLQTKLGITTRKLSKIETKVDRVETQTHLNAQLLRDANMKVDELTKKAEELTQRVLEIKKSSTSTIAKEEVTESKTTTEQMEATETTMSLLVAPTMIEKSANSETSLTMTLTRSTSPSPKTSSTMTVDSESPASQLAMARQARQRSQNEMKLRDEGLRNQAENRRRAWEQSKLRAEAKAKQKREKPEMVPESPEQENKFDMLARFEAWKEARDLSEDKRKQKKADLDKSVLLAHSEAKHKVPKEEQVSDIESELDQETKMRYDAWKRSKLQDATTGTTTKHVSSQSTMVDYRTSTSSSATKTPAAPESQTNVWPGSVPSSSTVPPTSPRFDPRSRSTPGDSTTIMVKAVRKDERNSIPSPSVPRATTQTSQYGQNEEPRVVLPVETVNFPAPADRPFFLEKPEGLYFLEVGEAAQVRLSVEAAATYNEPKAKSYNDWERIQVQVQAPAAVPEMTSPSPTQSGSWLGNLWRRLNRPDPAGSVRAGPSNSHVGPSVVPLSRNSRVQATTILSPISPEFAVRPTRSNDTVVSSNKKSVQARPSSRHDAVVTPNNKRFAPKPPSTLPPEFPEFAVRPTRPSQIDAPMNGTSSKSVPTRPSSPSTSRSMRASTANNKRSASAPPPEFSVVPTGEKTNLKPPYYARW